MRVIYTLEQWQNTRLQTCCIRAVLPFLTIPSDPQAARISRFRHIQFPHGCHRANMRSGAGRNARWSAFHPDKNVLLPTN